MKKNIPFLLLLIFHCFSISAQDKYYSEWYLQREDVDIFVKELGTGKDTVIVVHGGFGANHDYMLDAIKGLENRFHFVLYDQRGSLLSPTKKENLSFQKNVNDLYALVKEPKIKKVKLFCHSMGTLLGMEFTKQHPELVSNLVLAGALIPKSDSLQTVFSGQYEQRIKFLLNRQEVVDLIQPYKDKGIESLGSVSEIENSVFSHKELTEYWRIQYAAVNIYDIKKYNLLKGGRAYYNQDASIMVESVNWKYDYRGPMNNTKTTIINGAYDFFDFNGDCFKSLLKGFPNIQLDIIPDAGHVSWVDNPVLFRQHLLAALK